MSSPLRIAIIGGGIGGCTLANGLLKHPHITFDVFEGSSAVKEQGLSVGLAPNALTSLKRMGQKLHDGLKEAGGVATNSSLMIMGEGPDRGTVVCDLKDMQEEVIVHRGLFLRGLMNNVPPSQLHVNKKLIKIEENKSGESGLLTLHFEDGTKSEYHAVIGSDGIRSTVRAAVLIDKPDQVAPVFANFWDVRAAVPIDVAEKAGIVNHACKESIWLGDGGYIIHQLFNSGQLLGCFVAGVADSSYDGTKWRNPVDRAFLTQALGDRGEFGEKVISIMLDQPDSEPFAFSQYESAKASTYCRGRICIMGDAAHAMTPWQGSGAGTSIEDAFILETLLGRVEKPGEISAAFRAYDEVRRPRTQRIVESSREVGIASCGRNPDMGIDVKKLREGLPPKWEFIHGLDVDQHAQDAIAAFERYKAELK